MKRIEIYNRYLANINSSCWVESLSHRNGLEYMEYITKDTGIHFYTVGKLSLEYIERKAEYNKDLNAYVLKIKIDSMFKGFPVISMKEFARSVSSFRHDIIVDFSESDLSKIVDVTKLFGERRCRIIDVIFPDDDSKRLKPVKIDTMFSTKSVIDINSILDRVDLSEVSIASYAFSDTGVEIFDFDRCNFKNLEDATCMFFSCSNLKRIKGSFGSNKVLNVDSMFESCENLLEVDKNLYEGTVINHIDNMFAYCKNIEYTYLDRANIQFTGLETIGFPFICCDKMDLHELNVILEHIFSRGTKINGSIFSKSERDLFTGNYKLFRYKGYASEIAFFDDITSKVVDMSESDLNDDIFGIIDLFVHIGYLRPSVDCVYETGIKSSKIGKIPKILLINSEYKLRDLDEKVFNIVDFRGYESDIIDIKIKFMKADTTPDRFLVIVDKGWRNNRS